MSDIRDLRWEVSRLSSTVSSNAAEVESIKEELQKTNELLAIMAQTMLELVSANTNGCSTRKECMVEASKKLLNKED